MMMMMLMTRVLNMFVLGRFRDVITWAEAPVLGMPLLRRQHEELLERLASQDGLRGLTARHESTSTVLHGVCGVPKRSTVQFCFQALGNTKLNVFHLAAP